MSPSLNGMFTLLLHDQLICRALYSLTTSPDFTLHNNSYSEGEHAHASDISSALPIALDSSKLLHFDQPPTNVSLGCDDDLVDNWDSSSRLGLSMFDFSAIDEASNISGGISTFPSSNAQGNFITSSNEGHSFSDITDSGFSLGGLGFGDAMPSYNNYSHEGSASAWFLPSPSPLPQSSPAASSPISSPPKTMPTTMTMIGVLKRPCSADFDESHILPLEQRRKRQKPSRLIEN